MAKEFIEIISEQTKAQIDAIMPLVDKLAAKIKEINNFSPSNTPSGADNKIKGMTDAYKDQGNALEQVKKKLEMIASLNKQRYQEEAKLIADNDKALTYKSEKELKQIRDKQAMIASLNKQRNEEIAQAEKSALANQNLNRAYVQLTANREKAKQKLQDLIASQTASNAEIRKAQKEFDVLNKKVAAADKAVGKFSDANRHINGLTRSVGNLMAAFGISTGLYLFVDIIKGIYETTKELQSMDLALKMVSESEQQFAQNKVFITEVAQKWGLEIKSLQQTYTQFYTASKGLLSEQSIKETFEGIAKAGAVMGLSLEKQQAAFYAIDQMMSKGTVTAEELKKQLGNAMPGAIKAAAMAYMDLHPQIKTIQEAEKLLYQEMKKGAIDSATYVPLIAKNFQKLYGIEALNEVNTMQSAQNRLRNSYTEWIKSLTSGNSGASKTVQVLNFLAKNLATLLNTFIKGTVIVGTYLGVTKLLNFATRQSVLITEAYVIAKNALNARRVQSAVLTQRETALSILNTAATRTQTVSTVSLTGATEGATVATGLFNATLLKNPIVAVIALIMAGVTAYLLLADSTDDATNSLIAHEQAKRDAEKQAVKDVKAISKAKDDFQKRLEIETKQLDKLRKIQQTASLAELQEINDRIEAKEREINITKEKLRLEGINVKEKSKVESDKAYVAAHKADAEKNSLELKKLNAEEQLRIKKKFINTKEGIANYKNTLAQINSLKVEIEVYKKQILEKNVEITRQNKIFNELRPETNPSLKNPIKNVDWYDQQIKALNDKRGKLSDQTGKDGKALQKQIDDYQAIRDKIAGEENKKRGNKSIRKRKEIDFTESISGIELIKAENERELAAIEQRMNNEETNFDDRLKLRTEFSLKSLEILDDELDKEKAIINKKRLDDLKTVDRGLRNGDIKNTEEAKKQRVAIRNRVNNELAKIEIDHSTKTQGLWANDVDFYKKIQREKEDLAIDTAKTLSSIEKDKFDRIAKNEELGINYSLKTRQKAFEESVKIAKKELEVQYELDKARHKNKPEQLANIEANYKKANTALDNLISPTKEASESTRKLVESLSDGQLDKALGNIGLKSAKNFLDFKIVDGKSQSTFGKMMEEAKATESQLDDLAIAFNAIGNVALDAMSIADEAAQTRHQNALNRLEKEKEVALRFTGDSAAAKAKIEAEYDRKKQALEKKEFKRQQKMALANIAINTAMGVMSVMSTGGGTRYADFGVSAGTLSAIVIGLGAVQAGMVLAQKPPEYWKGTDNAEAGLAWTQERGSELILDKNNRIKSFGSDGGAQLTMMEKGDKVKTANQTKKLMFDIGLNSILSDNGIKEAKIEVINKGLTVNEMDSVLSKHFAKITTQHVSFDQRGIQQWSEANGNKTIRNANRGSGIGYKV